MWWNAIKKTTALRTIPSTAPEIILSLPPTNMLAGNLATKSARRSTAIEGFGFITYAITQLGKGAQVPRTVWHLVLIGAEAFGRSMPQGNET